jgi:LysM repeat protein
MMMQRRRDSVSSGEESDDDEPVNAPLLSSHREEEEIEEVVSSRMLPTSHHVVDNNNNTYSHKTTTMPTSTTTNNAFIEPTVQMYHQHHAMNPMFSFEEEDEQYEPVNYPTVLPLAPMWSNEDTYVFNNNYTSAPIAEESIYPSLLDLTSNDYMSQQENSFYEMMDLSILPKNTLSPSAPYGDFISDQDSATTTTTTGSVTDSVSSPKARYSVVTEEQYHKTGGPLPSFLLHKLQKEDTLMKLAISYGVFEERIKMANNILTELEYYNKPEIIIPYPTCIPEKSIPEVEVDLEKKKREWALKFFVRLKGVSIEEATYYLSLHEYEFRHAIEEYDSDIIWQREYEARKKQKSLAKQKKHLPLWKRNSVIQLLSNCIPFLITTNNSDSNDLYGDLELDEIDGDEEQIEDGYRSE